MGETKARRVPEVIRLSDGAERKRQDVRLDEIRALAAQGMRASQIAESLGIGEQRVRAVAAAFSLALPDDAIGQRRRVDPHRVLLKTVSGVESLVAGLALIEGFDVNTLSAEDVAYIHESLKVSVNALRVLRTRIEKAHTHARSNAHTA
jgi:hypothetical protein